MNPVGIVDGFYAVIGASGSFFPEHVTIPVNASFYQVSEDIAASPYLVSHQLYQDLNKLFEILFKSFKIVILNYDRIISIYFQGHHKSGFFRQTRLQSTQQRNNSSGKY